VLYHSYIFVSHLYNSRKFIQSSSNVVYAVIHQVAALLPNLSCTPLQSAQWSCGVLISAKEVTF